MKIGSYEIEGLLGRGAAARVFRARDPNLHRTVAVKLLEPTGEPESEERLRGRFRREGISIARLTHPAILRVYEVGEHEGQPFLVMELAGRGTLEDRIAADPDPSSLLPLLRDVARGVGFAHRAGILHRDLKPGNILIDDGGRARVADFGLARLEDASTVLTRTGSPVGTPLYMAPEQVDPRLGPITPATDVHALGAILYRIATGHPPYAADTTAALFHDIVAGQLTRPSRRTPGVDPRLERIVLQSLARRAKDRYRTASELADDLDRLLDGRPVRARRPRPRLRPIAVALVSLVSLVLVGGALGRMAFARRPPIAPTPSKTIGPGPEAGPESLAPDRTQLLIRIESSRRALDEAETYLRDEAADFATFRERLNSTRTLLEQTTLLAPDLAVAHYLLGRCWSLIGWDERAEASWRRTLDLDGDFGPAHFHLGRLLLGRAFLHQVLEERELVIEDIPAGDLTRKALEHFERAVALGSGFEDRLARAAAAIGVAYASGDLGAASSQALAARREHSEEPGREWLDWLVGITSAPGSTERRAAFDRALEIAPRFPLALVARAAERGTPDTTSKIADLERCIETAPRLLAAHLLLASALGERGDHEIALDRLERAHRTFPGDYRVHHAILTTYFRMGDAEGGLDATDWAEVDAGPGPPGALAFNRGLFLIQLGCDREALEQLDRAVAALPDAARYRFNRSTIRARMGDAEGARADLERIAASDPSTTVPFFQAQALRGLGRRREAVEVMRREVEEHPYSPTGWILLGQILTTSTSTPPDELTEALEAFDRAVALEPGSDLALHGRATVLADLDRLEEALVACEPLRAKAHLDSSVLALRGRILQQLGRHREAIADLDTCLANESDPLAGPLIWRARSRMALGRTEDALQDVERAIDRDPDDSDAYTLRGALRIETGDAEGGIEDLRRVTALHPERPKAWFNEGYALERSKRYDEAEAAYTLAIELSPGYVLALSNRASCREARGDLDGAAADIRAALDRVEPDDPLRRQLEERLESLGR